LIDTPALDWQQWVDYPPFFWCFVWCIEWNYKYNQCYKEKIQILVFLQSY
jgi:hypothetical protein